jgi:hypothetical protein
MQRRCTIIFSSGKNAVKTVCRILKLVGFQNAMFSEIK